MKKIIRFLMVMTISFSLFSQASLASRMVQDLNKPRRSIPIGKIIIASAIIGTSFYFRADISKFVKNNFTPENFERARRIAVDDVMRPVARNVAEEGPRIVREHISRVIIATIIGGVARMF